MRETCKAKLRLLGTTDLHMKLTGYDYVLENHKDVGGLEKLSGMIAALRSQDVETILCDNGDFIEGSPLADTAMDLDDMNEHPLIRAMNLLQYDAISLGNHDFDYGTQKLKSVMNALDAKVLCSNVRIAPQIHFATPWTIVERDLLCSDGVKRKIKVGLIGFVTPVLLQERVRDQSEPLTTDDIIAAGMTHLPAMRRAGADIIVALAHTGIGPTHHFYGMENAALPLASLRGIDVLMLGHTHDRFPSEKFTDTPGVEVERGLIWGTPAVLAGDSASDLGVIDLTLLWQDDDWHIANQTVRTIDAETSNAPPFEPFQDQIKPLIAPLHTATLNALAKPVAQTPAPITTYFSLAGYDPSLKLLAQAKMDAVRSSLTSTHYEGLPLLGAASAFFAGGRQNAENYVHIEPGAITAKHIAALSPFDNSICGVLRRGWQVRQWLERVSEQFNVIPKRPGHYDLINLNHPTYLFDTLFGLEYSFDLTAPLARLDAKNHRDSPSRVKSMTFCGSEVFDDDVFVVATTRYRALTGDGIGIVPKEDIIGETPAALRSQVTKRLRDGHDWDASPNWTFAPAPGARVRFKSSAKSTGLIPDPAIKPIGAPRNGLQEFERAL